MWRGKEGRAGKAAGVTGEGRFGEGKGRGGDTHEEMARPIRHASRGSGRVRTDLQRSFITP